MDSGVENTTASTISTSGTPRAPLPPAFRRRIIRAGFHSLLAGTLLLASAPQVSAADSAAAATRQGDKDSSGAAASKSKVNDAYSPSKAKPPASATSSAPSSAPAKSAAKGETSAWQSHTDVTPANAGAAAYPPDSPCAPIHRNIETRIRSIRTMRAQIDKANAAPPRTVVGTFKKWMDDGYESPAAAKYKRKISEAWNAAEELNARLVAAECAPVDIEKEIAKGGASASDSPIEAPAEVKTQTMGDSDRTIFDEPARQ